MERELTGMKITLILAAAKNDPLKKNDPFMPLSLPLIAASAPNHEYTFVDMLSGEIPDFDAPVDLVGISARITAEKKTYEIADAYREQGIKVVLGGAQVSSNAQQAIDHADAVVVGEGEGVWPVLLDDLARGRLKDFYLGSASPFDPGERSVHKSDAYLDLGTVQSALLTRKYYEKRYVFDTVFAARGCAQSCDFCSVGHLFGKKTRVRPVAEVVKEIASFKGFYYLLDDTVFGRPSTYGYYADLYEAIGRLDKVNFWTGQANLDAAATATVTYSYSGIGCPGGGCSFSLTPGEAKSIYQPGDAGLAGNTGLFAVTVEATGANIACIAKWLIH